MFEKLLSNTQMKRELTLAVQNNRPSHAYLFCGAEGSGKKTAAYLFAKAIVGKNADKADRGSHPDIITIAPPENKKIISVDAIRQMRSDAFITPSEGTRKIYVIDKAHLLNDSGQNALLTILEQPPSFAVFILLADSREKMLSTVVSRCSVYEMEYVDATEGARLLEKQYPDLSFDRLKTAMNAAQGNIGLAHKLLSGNEFEKNCSICESIMLAVAKDDEYTVAKLLTPKKKQDPTPLLSVLGMYIKDILVYNTTGNADRLIFRESILKNATFFDKIDCNILYSGSLGTQKTIELINGNVNPALAAATLTIQLYGGELID